MKRLVSIFIVLGLAGCGNGGMEDLQTFVAETGKDMQGKIEPLPEVKVYEPLTYNAFDLPDPFKPRKLSTGGGGGMQPDLTRPKEPLEAFSLETLKMVGVLSKEDAIRWGVTGPALRASGVKHDLRKDQPYSGYELYDFEVPTHTDGDTYARYLMRIEEMRQSVRIVQQALDKLPYGPVRSNNRKFVPPPRAELGTSMEAVIHHFKLWTEGFSVQAESVYVAVESPRGELGVYLEGDGSPKPHRIYWRTPSFANLQILPLLSKGHLVADLVALIGTVDIVLGDVDR